MSIVFLLSKKSVTDHGVNSNSSVFNAECTHFAKIAQNGVVKFNFLKKFHLCGWRLQGASNLTPTFAKSALMSSLRMLTYPHFVHLGVGC